jgi:hypothetical protein
MNFARNSCGRSEGAPSRNSCREISIPLTIWLYGIAANSFLRISSRYSTSTSTIEPSTTSRMIIPCCGSKSILLRPAPCPRLWLRVEGRPEVISAMTPSYDAEVGYLLGEMVVASGDKQLRKFIGQLGQRLLKRKGHWSKLITAKMQDANPSSGFTVVKSRYHSQSQAEIRSGILRHRQ